MNRRQFLALAGTLTSTVITGCSSSGESGPEPPADDADPRELLPSAPDGWTRDNVQEQSAGMVGAEAGYGAQYRNGEETYGVEVLRWPSAGDASDTGVEVYRDWAIVVPHGAFTFAVKGADEDTAATILGESSALTDSFAREHNEAA